nr:anti-repressor SinI family protein [Lederbergia lenta]
MDKEWMWLIIEAKNLGIAKEEIRQFLEKKRVKDLGLL